MNNKRHIKSILNQTRGMYLPIILLATVFFMALATAIISLSLSNIKIAQLHEKKITSMEIAEAGVNYYMWHLSHNNTDYCDGSSCIGEGEYGPYTHNYLDNSGHMIGTYSLYIEPPTVGNNITTVRSIGTVSGSNIKRTIVATIGMPSYTKYTLMVNGSQLWVGPNEKITGTVHVNGSGLYNQGEISGDASSTELTYNGWFGTQSGVSGTGVFGGSKLFPVPSIDTNQINVDLVNIRNEAKVNNLGGYYNTLSGYNGYHLVLNANNYELRKVERYDNVSLEIIKETAIGVFSYPSDGVLFFEDNVWLEGTIKNQKITIIASDPEASSSQRKRVLICEPVKYTSYDGSDKIGLISQSDILVTRDTPNDMEIDAAMIAKDGQIKIKEYSGLHKGNIKVYGSMAHTVGLAWTYSSGSSWNGFVSTETIIDQQNVLDPPPKFPLTGTFNILSWREE